MTIILLDCTSIRFNLLMIYRLRAFSTTEYSVGHAKKCPFFFLLLASSFMYSISSEFDSFEKYFQKEYFRWYPVGQ